MAFIGIFALAGIALIIFFILFTIFFLVFVPCLIISIINLVHGIKNNWPKRNIIALSITGSITILFIMIFTIFFVLGIVNNTGDAQSSSSSMVEVTRLLSYLL